MRARPRVCSGRSTYELYRYASYIKRLIVVLYYFADAQKVLFGIYLLQYLDKNGINYASVYGLQAGTNLHGQQYSWLGSIFYFGEFCLRNLVGTQYMLTALQATWSRNTRQGTCCSDYHLAKF
jgi:hypothetical protein